MNWKVPGWAAAAGAVVSLVAALAGGNPVGTILLRMVVSALVAGALGLGARFVLRRFLPGIEAPSAPPTVDILLDEELPLAPQEGRGQEEELGAAVEDLAEEADGGQGLGESEGELGLAETEPFPELPEAEGPQAPETEPFPEQSGQRSEAAAEELPSGELEALSAADSDAFSDSEEAGLPSRRALKAEELEAQLDSVTKGQDPASLAKAVRTFLRKDQEG